MKLKTTPSILLAGALFIHAVGALAQVPTGINDAGQLVEIASVETPGFTFAKLQSGVQIRVGGLTKNILFYGPGIVRVNANPGKADTTQPSLTIMTQPAAVPFETKDTANTLTISSEKLHVLADKKTGALTFQRPDGTVITREKSAEVKEVTISDAPTYEVRQTFTLTPDESLYGLGQYNQRYMDYRGKEVLLVQTNIGIVIPLLVSTNRYGILWDIYSKSIFKDNASGASFWAESAPAGVDYYFIAGQDMDGVIAGYRQLTGKAPMFAKSAFGLWMSKERYKTQDRLIEVVREFRKQQIPLDNIVQDWQYWGGHIGARDDWKAPWDDKWSGMIWDKERFPDPVALTKTLHDELHVKLMNSIWPSIGNGTELAHELDAKGLRFEPLHWITKQARIYDAFSAEGREIYFKHVKKGLLDVGVDALWMDGTEVEVGSACHDAAKVEADIKSLGKNALGDFTRYLNPYSLETTKGVYEGQRANGNKRVLTLTRSSWAGQQRYAALPWSGDTTSSWQTFRDQIAGGINVAFAGHPYWTQDTGGFFVPGNWRKGRETTPEYNELFARWNQFGAFNPIYRIHGADIEREPYVFKDADPEVFQSLIATNHLRYRLLPYIYSLAWMSTAQDYTMMRGLPMDFPDDKAARKLDDEFMFGPAFLVHPVTRAMVRVPTPPPGTIPAAVFRTPDGKPGIEVQYFEGRNFEKPAGKIIEAKVDHTWPGPPLAEPPAGLKSCDNFSARWEATITMPEDGEYEIGAEGDDGVRVWLDGKLTVDDWGTHAMRWKGQKLTFRKGQQVALKIDYNQGSGDRGLRLGWRTPSELKDPTGKKVADAQETYLPSGADWYDFWTNVRHPGGQTVKQSVPLDRMPLFVRAGSIVPFGPVVQYATEKPDAPYEVRVYPGANATFTLYEDDNETYDYEKGRRDTCTLSWNDAERTLTIGERKGSFPGMISTRTLNIVLAAPDQNAGITAAPQAVKSITYTGKPIAVKF
ncbi:MAG: TIM-barrel domain-containing protein [Chthoniobacterales bacterium]